MRLFRKAGASAHCPYCGFHLQTNPRNKSKCPECKNVIRVSNSEGKTTLYTEEDWLEYRTKLKEQSFASRWLRNLEVYGASKQEFEANKKKFTDKNGFEPRNSDVIWGLLQEILLSTMKSGDFHDLKMVYWQQARFLYEEGRDHLNVARLSIQSELENYKHEGVISHVEVLACDMSCPACRKLSRLKVSIEDAMTTMPIPCPSCTNEPSSAGRGWCRCTYVGVID